MKKHLLLPLLAGVTASAMFADVPSGFPETLPEGVLGYSQVTDINGVHPGRKYVILAVNASEGWSGDAFLAATTETVDGADVNVAEFMTLSQLTDASIPTENLYWTATAQVASNVAATSGCSTTNFSLQSASGYFHSRHGNASHNTAANQGALVFETGRQNYVYATKIVETPGVYGSFALRAATKTELESYGQIFNIRANSNCGEGATSLNTCLGVNQYAGSNDNAGRMEICAGNAGNYYNATTTSYFVVYEVLTDDYTKEMAEEELSSYKDAKATMMSTYGVMTKAAALAAFESIVITDADDLRAEVSNRIAEVDAAVVPAYVAALDGCKVTIRNHSTGNGSYDYIYGVAAGETLKHNSALDIESVWTAHKTDDNKVKFSNNSHANYAAGLVAGEEADAIAYEIAFVRADGTVVIKNTEVSGDNGLNQFPNGNIGYWGCAADQLGSNWRIEPVTEAVEQTLIANIQIRTIVSHLGTNPGQYATTDERVDDIKAKCASLTASDLDYVLALELKNTELTDMTQNPVAPGSYIRISNGANTQYFAMNESSTTFIAHNAEDVAPAIFYYTPSNRLINYVQKAGAVRKAATSGDGHKLTNKTTAAQHDDFEANTHVINFEHSALTTDNCFDQFAITWEYPEHATNKVAFLAFNNGVGWGSQTSNQSLANAVNATNYQTIWTFKVEYVSELPVALDAQGFATFVAEVETSVPEGVKAHSVILNHATGVADYSEIEGNIPAHTAVLLKGTPNTTVEMHIVNTGVAALADIQTGLTGSSLSKAVGADEKILVLGTNTGEKSSFMAATADEEIKHPYILGDDSTENNEYVLADKAISTSINEVAAPAGAVVEGIYDLQGRKLAQPVKGINIINGRKVLVK